MTVLWPRREPDINTLPNKRERESANSRITHFPVIGAIVETDIENFTVNERIPALEANTLSGIMAKERTRY